VTNRKPRLLQVGEAKYCSCRGAFRYLPTCHTGDFPRRSQYGRSVGADVLEGRFLDNPQDREPEASGKHPADVARFRDLGVFSSIVKLMGWLKCLSDMKLVGRNITRRGGLKVLIAKPLRLSPDIPAEEITNQMKDIT